MIQRRVLFTTITQIIIWLASLRTLTLARDFSFTDHGKYEGEKVVENIKASDRLLFPGGETFTIIRPISTGQR